MYGVVGKNKKEGEKGEKTGGGTSSLFSWESLVLSKERKDFVINLSGMQDRIQRSRGYTESKLLSIREGRGRKGHSVRMQEMGCGNYKGG